MAPEEFRFYVFFTDILDLPWLTEHFRDYDVERDIAANMTNPAFQATAPKHLCRQRCTVEELAARKLFIDEIPRVIGTHE